jgi:zinc protease
LYEKLRAVLFAGTPYEHDALGTRTSFDKTTAAMLKDFHDKWYAPNNAILILVGDLDPEATLERVKTLFGPIASKTLPARPVFSPQPAVAESIAMDTDHPEGKQIIALRVPGLDSPDFPALEVLADVISSERGDLYALVPQGKALDTDFSIEALSRAGLVYAEATFPEGSDPKVLESDLRSVLGEIAKNGVPAELVAAAKLQERRQAEFQKNSIAGLASVWANAVAVYGLNSPADDLDRIEKVTVDDVNRAARTYLNLDHALSAVMLPRSSGRPTAASAGFGGQENIVLGEAKPTPLPDWAESAVSRLSVPPSTIHPIVSVLPNGLTLIVQREDVSDTVSIYGHIRNRPETEAAPGKQGVSQCLNELFSYGSETLDRLAFQEALDEIGASERAGTDFMIQALVRDFDRAAELLADNELHPALPAPAMDIFKDQLVRVLAARNRSPDYLTQRSLREALFPADDPSLRDATPETVGSLTIDDVRTYYHTVVRPDLSTIVVIGKVTPELARVTIEKYFGAWSATGPKPVTDLPTAPPNRASIVAVPDAARVQDTVVLAQNMALTRSDPDYYALQLGSAVLGGAFYSTRLSTALRKNAGLVYSIGSNLNSGKTRSAYLVQYACDPKNVTRASAMVVQELKSMQTAPAGMDELVRVKALLLRQIPLEESSVARIAGGLTQRWDLELPLDEPTRAAQRYVALGPGDVQAAFQKWIRPDDLVRISQGPAPQ